ncbi:MAG TPA: hypothetical protein VJ508_00205 [Saprospiraceae bacterium]|nr:hypothetical protein [Saprospiraceae bacterium]
MKFLQSLRYLLSYIIELPVVQTSTPYNPDLKVRLHQGRYKLIARDAIYSFSDLYSNFRRAFKRLKWEECQIQTCLVLGLGLGSIPDMLTTRFHKSIRFTAVEIDSVVSNLAFQYVLGPKKIPLELFNADAGSFLQWHKGHYDLICSDVFVGDTIPPELQTVEALTAMKNMLRPNGLLLYNRLSRYRLDIDKSLKFRDEAFLKVFPEGGYLDVDGNWMFVNRMSAFTTT